MWLRRASLPKRQQEEQQQPDESNVRRVRKPNLASPSATPIKRTTSQRYERTSYPDMMMYISADRRRAAPKVYINMSWISADDVCACYACGLLCISNSSMVCPLARPVPTPVQRTAAPLSYPRASTARIKANFVAHAAEAVSR